MTVRLIRTQALQLRRCQRLLGRAYFGTCLVNARVRETRGYMGLVPVDQAVVISHDDYTQCGAPESDCVDFKFQDWKNIFDPSDPFYSSNISV